MSKSLQVTTEAIVTGMVMLVAAAFIANAPQFPSSGGGLLLLVSGACFVGYLITNLAEWLFQPWQRQAEMVAANRLGVPHLDISAMLNALRARIGNSEETRVEHHDARIRLSRDLALGGFLLLVLAVAKGRPALIWATAPVCAVAIFSVRHETIRLVGTVAQFLKQERGPEVRTPAARTQTTVSAKPLPDGVSVKVLVFAGGTAFRNCNIALARRGHHVTRIVPSWDNGGSSRALRDEFDVLSIGDIRQALMTMAHGENNSNEVIRLFNWRLSEDADDSQLLAEMESFIREEHPRIAGVPTDLRNVILRYLESFWSARPPGLPLRNGSIGNFVLLGAFLAHGRDMNTAIYVFRQLCGIRGHVWPVSLLGDLHLCARLEDGETIVGEEQVTDIKRPDVQSRIEKTFLTRGKDHSSPSSPADANPLVLNSFADADVIIFGPGSFFTSVLPHLRVAGVVDALAHSEKPKLFVGNMREGNECFGWSLAELVVKFLATCHEFASEPREATRYLTRIVAHDSTAYQRGVRGDSFMSVEGLDRFRAEGIEVVFGDLEDPWKRGHHDGNALAARIVEAHVDAC